MRDNALRRVPDGSVVLHQIDDDHASLGRFLRLGGTGRRAIYRDLDARLLVAEAVLLFAAADLLDNERRQHR
jgi:hypothetical protein